MKVLGSRAASALIAIGLLGGGTGTPALADALSIMTGGGGITVPVVTFREQRFAGVVRQEHDFSCGAAAIATLLSYHYGTPTTERQVFDAMMAGGDRAAIEREGFSLLDMQGYLARVGFSAEGFRTSLDKLLEAGVPAITLINSGGYMHFVVVKGIRGRKVLLADPAFGNKVLGAEEFEGSWTGVLFAITSNIQDGRSTFNGADQWRITASAPLEAAKWFYENSSILSLPSRNFF